MIVKFIKDHAIGFRKGFVLDLSQKTAETFKVQGYVVDGTEQEFEEFKASRLQKVTIQEVENTIQEPQPQTTQEDCCEEVEEEEQCEDCKKRKKRSKK